MNSLRRWLYRPKQSDSSLLAQFYFADEELNFVAAELDSFEGRKDPERCTTLINQLRACQARVLNVISQMMDDAVKGQRAPRDFRVKFPDDVIQDNLAGQLWFGAECLAAGSSIMNREVESAAMRPLARALTKNLDSLRSILREQCLHNVHEYTEEIKESLIIFDKLFAEFELSYVSAMVPVKSAHEYDMIQEITVLFSETVQRSLKSGHLTREMIDEYDPALMFTIPRLAIVCGVLIFNDGPLNPDNDPWNISEMFRPFQTLLLKIRELLTILTDEERNTLERALCSQEEPSFLISLEGKKEKRKNDEKPSQKSGGNKKCEGDGDDGSVESELTALEIAERLEALASSFVASRNGEGSKQAAGSENSEKRSKDAEETSSASMSSDSVEDIEGLNQGPEEESIMDSGCRVAAEGGRGSDSAVDQQNQASNPAELASAFVQEIDVIDSPNSDKRDTEHSENAPCAESDDGGISKHDTVSSSDMKRFSLNKCDSHDSGLHSEALSTSGSMLMISSSDSSHLIGSSDMPLSSTSLCSDAAGQTSPSTATTDITEIDCNATSQPIVSSTYNTSPSVSESLDSSHTMVPDSGASEQSASPTIVSGKAEGESLFKKEIQDTCVAVEEPVVSVSSHSQQRRDSSAETIQSVLCIPKYCNSNETTVDAKELGSVKCEPSEVNENMNACSSSEVMCSLNSDCIKVQEDEECSTEEFSEDRGGPQMDEKMGINQMCSDLAHSIVSNAVLASLVTSNHSQDNQTVILQAQCASNDVKGESSQANSSSGYTSEDSPSTSSSCNTPKESSGKSFSDAQKLESPSLAVEGAVGDDNNANSGTDVSLSHSCAGAESKSKVPASQSGEKSSGENPVSHVVTEVRTENSTAKTGAESASENSAAVPSTSKSAASIGAHGPSDTVVHKPPRGTHKKKSSSKSQKSSSTRRRRQEEGAASSYSRDQGICSVQNTAKRIMDAHLLDSDCCNSSETSSYTSDCGDQEEIALAIEAAESATRDQVRARFRSSSDMIHRLFVCISGVADQLQTNFAGDLRNILRAVFDMNCSEPIDVSDNDKSKDLTPLGAAYRAISNASRTSRRRRHSSHARQEPPRWIPDEECNACMACQVPFTFVRRRHHCRNCGKIFCSRCSSNFVPLPHFGQDKAVRVCNRCFMFRVTPFTVRPS